MATINRYVVCEDDNEWADGDLFDSFLEADEAARERGACVVEVEYEYSDNETVKDYRPAVPCPDCKGTSGDPETPCPRCDGAETIPAADLTREERDAVA